MVFVKRKYVFIRLYRPSPAGYSHSGAEFTTAQEVPDTSTQMHSKYIPTYLTMVFVTKEYVFVRLYCPSRQASRTLERSSSLHQNRSGVHCTKGTRWITSNAFQIHSYVLTMGFVKKRYMCSSGSITLRCRPLALRSGVHHCTRTGMEFTTAPNST